MTNLYEDRTTGWNFPVDFDMPSAREIELDLALGSESWQSLLAPNQAWRGAGQSPAGNHAIVAVAARAEWRPWSSSWPALERLIRTCLQRPGRPEPDAGGNVR